MRKALISSALYVAPPPVFYGDKSEEKKRRETTLSNLKGLTPQTGDQQKERNIEIVGADLATRYGFTQVPNFILTNKDSSVDARPVGAILPKYAWDNDARFPGQPTLAQPISNRGEASLDPGMSNLKLRMQPRRDDRNRAAILVVRRIEDELIIQRQLKERHRQFVIALDNLFGAGMRQHAVAD